MSYVYKCQLFLTFLAPHLLSLPEKNVMTLINGTISMIKTGVPGVNKRTDLVFSVSMTKAHLHPFPYYTFFFLLATEKENKNIENLLYYKSIVSTL